LVGEGGSAGGGTGDEGSEGGGRERCVGLWGWEFVMRGEKDGWIGYRWEKDGDVGVNACSG